MSVPSIRARAHRFERPAKNHPIRSRPLEPPWAIPSPEPPALRATPGPCIVTGAPPASRRGPIAVDPYCKLTGITTYTKSPPLLITPGLFPALSSMITCGSLMTFRASVMKVGLNPISMSSPS